MPFGFSVAAVSVSGSLVTVAARTFNGIGPCRLYVKNTGDQDLTAAKVQIGPAEDALYDYDTATFATLAAGAMLSLALPAPVNAVKLLATCAAGTTVSAWLSDEARQQG